MMQLKARHNWSILKMLKVYPQAIPPLVTQGIRDSTARRMRRFHPRSPRHFIPSVPTQFPFRPGPSPSSTYQKKGPAPRARARLVRAERSLRQFHEHFVPLHGGLEGGHLEGRVGAHALPAGDVELEPVPRARHHLPLQGPFPQRAAAVGTGVVRCVVPSPHVVQGHRGPVRFHHLAFARLQIVHGADLHAAGHTLLLRIYPLITPTGRSFATILEMPAAWQTLTTSATSL